MREVKKMFGCWACQEKVFMKNLLLLSNSRMPGREYLEHAVDAIRETLGGAKKVVLIPYALGG